MEIFIDTSAIISGFIESDSNHYKAKRFLKNVSPLTIFSTTDLVYFESLTVISMKFGLAETKTFSRYFKNLPLKMLDIGDKEIMKAEHIIFSQKSKNISFFDCLYVSLVKLNNIDKIFTYDKDIAKLGVSVVG